MKILRDYNLSIVLFSLFILFWSLQTYAGWVEFQAEQLEHQQIAEVFGSDGYIWKWAAVTLENWQSEFLQLFAMVVLTSIFIHKGSAESRDSQDKILASLERIEERLKN